MTGFRFHSMAPLALLALAACQPDPGAGGAPVAGNSSPTTAYAGIAEGETLHVLGTEPFWGGEVTGGAMTYDTPEDPDGTNFSVERFAGLNGLGFSGMLDGQEMYMAVTPGECSDGMSDRSFPFTVTLQIGAETRYGCGWTESQPFTGPEAP